MTRDDAKIAAQIMLDYANGGELQNWSDTLGKYISAPFATFNWCDNVSQYRIKPKLEYVPFDSCEECLAEMYKHKDFGLVYSVNEHRYEYNIICVAPNKIYIKHQQDPVSFKDAFKRFRFVDDKTPFGKEIIND